MARPLRIEFKGALYHILSRGNERRNIFFGDDDYKESDVELLQLNRIKKDKDPAKFLKSAAKVINFNLNIFCGEPQGKHCQIRNIQAI